MLAMIEPNSISDLPIAVQAALDSVRRRIRVYVLLEGMAIVVAVIGVMFWLGLALDWYFEASADTRRIAIVAAACITSYVCYRYLLRRLIVPISDTSLAILLERRFP